VSAETLRRAASLMRERAERATAGVCPEWTRQAIRHIARNCEIECCYSHGDDSPETVPHDSDGDSEATWSRYDDADHVASWHPVVALAVADLLDRVAYTSEAVGAEPSPDMTAVALAYLGES
jgi:hypothetical protein